MARTSVLTQDPLRRWTVADAAEMYNIQRWSSGYFGVNEAGNVVVTPRGAAAGAIDMKALVDELTRRGIQLPLLLRFSDILRSRIELLNNAFAAAIKDCEFTGQYRGVYPIKVNQTRRVVEEIIAFGRPFHYGLEAGSKPELLATMAMHEDPEALVICNGYKDDEYIETALLASKLGRTVVLVIEKLSEIDHIHRVATRLGIRPSLGIRARLSTRGAGRWEQSGGDRSKFGLSAADMMVAIRKLREWGELDCLKLLHFHLGSQISAIRSIKNALREAGRFYVELYKMGCHGLRYFDVGGGLGVDYDGSQTNFASSMNYSVQEYANDVVFALAEICNADGVPHPTIVTESGRAVAAHHSVLVINILGVSEFDTHQVPTDIPEDADPILKNLFETHRTVNKKNLLESYHDALEYKDQGLQAFNLGHMDLETRVMCEQLFWVISQKILGHVRTMNHVPEDLEGLEKTLSDTYFCNFSMFQSVPDAWAIDQLFPIMPIHRLKEEPSRRGVLADITCDSDGCIDRFIDLREVKRVLELHPGNAHPYFLGIFLVGAYQEILGDMHNLFGDTNTIHVSLGPDGRYLIEEVFSGDTVADVLQYVNYSPKGLLKKLRQNVEVAIKKGLMTLNESRELIDSYRLGLSGYTYLERE
jgi:arginine decarboxylase